MATSDAAVEVDGDKLMQFVFRAVDEVGATLNSALVVMGDKLGLYRALAGTGGLSPRRAGRAHRHRRALRSRVAQRTGGRRLRRVRPATAAATRCRPSRRLRSTDDRQPGLPAGVLPDRARLGARFAADHRGVPHAARASAGTSTSTTCHEGCERFFRPGYNANLVAEWLPALDGVDAKLERGARVADVGCGHGASTILMAKAFPNSTFVGFDYHAGSIDAAARAGTRPRASATARASRSRAARATRATATTWSTMFDCLHDMGDPVGAARHVRAVAGAGRHLDDRRAASPATGSRTTSTRSGACSTRSPRCSARRRRCRRKSGWRSARRPARRGSVSVVTAGGFTRFRRVAETPFNLVFEARP